jgi:CRISPR-associated protein Cas6
MAGMTELTGRVGAAGTAGTADTADTAENASMAGTVRAVGTDDVADIVELSFELRGHTLPRSYRSVLAAALTERLPWLPQTPAAAVHRLNLSAGGGGEALLSRRTRLTLRLPRERLAAAAALCGARLAIGGHELAVGPVAEARELQPFHTLYAHVVADPGPEVLDELAFQRHVQDELAARGWRCRAIFGRRVSLEEGRLHGAPVMLDGLAPAVAQAVMCRGLGAHLLLGCGIFVPHRSAAAVGRD